MFIFVRFEAVNPQEIEGYWKVDCSSFEVILQVVHIGHDQKFFWGVQRIIE
jgi:hypothetical protein